jgi:hypothetical protein
MPSGEGKKLEKTHAIERTDSEDSNPVLMVSSRLLYCRLICKTFKKLYNKKHKHLKKYIKFSPMPQVFLHNKHWKALQHHTNFTALEALI